MRKIISLIIVLMAITSCSNDLPGFEFESFNGTEANDLAIAVKNENIIKIREIVNENKDLVDFLDPKFGHSLLMLSVANNLDKSVNELLELGADPNKRSNPNDNSSSEITTAVFIACNKVYVGNCNTNNLETLVDYNGEINDKIEVRYLNSRYISIETPLMLATESNCLNLVKKIVELGADINDYSYINGKGPLSNCIIHDNLNILEYLIIEENAKIPNYLYVRSAHNNTPRQELTIIEFLNEQKYPENSKNDFLRKKIINYIQNR